MSPFVLANTRVECLKVHELTVTFLTWPPGSGHRAAVVWVELGLARESHVESGAVAVGGAAMQRIGENDRPRNQSTEQCETRRLGFVPRYSVRMTTEELHSVK
jgi:hypothetical protein